MPQRAPPHDPFSCNGGGGAGKRPHARIHRARRRAPARWPDGGVTVPCFTRVAFRAHMKRRYSSFQATLFCCLSVPYVAVSPPRRAALSQHPAMLSRSLDRATRPLLRGRSSPCMWFRSSKVAVPAAAFWEVPCSRPRLRRAASGPREATVYDNKINFESPFESRGAHAPSPGRSVRAYPHEAVAASLPSHPD